LAGTLAEGYSSSVQQDEARAERLLREVLERDPNRSMAHAAMGLLRRVQHRMVESEVELKTAITLDPNNELAVRQLGFTLEFSGQPGAAIPYIEKSIRLNPRMPSLAAAYLNLGACHLFLGHADEAIDFLRKARVENPRLWYVRLVLAGALGLSGDIDGAKGEIAEALKVNPQINSLARWRAVPGLGDPQFQAQMEKTVNVGLRRAGFPDE